MRTGPSTSAAIITRLAPGTEVVVHYEKDGWAYITANGRTGYVSTQYLIDAPKQSDETPDHRIKIQYQEYDITLDEFLAIQLKANPQTDKKYNVYIRSDP